MATLVAGLLLFSVVHLIPSLAPALKTSWKGKLGTDGYRGTFSLLLLASIGLIVTGWRSTPPALVYTPLAQLHGAAIGLLYFAFLLLVVSIRRSRLKRVFRHPQLTGVALWSVAHLLLNGDHRSLLLFGWMGVWAVVEMIAISRREGAWVRAEIPPWRTESLSLLITAALVAAVIYGHPWIAGVPVY